MKQNTRTALVIGGVAIAILLGVSLLWGGSSGWQGGGWGMMGPGMMGGFGMGFGVVFMVLVMWAMMAMMGGGMQHGGYDHDSHSDRPDSALEVLKRRYARGDIGKEEYEEKKRDLV
ncbi:MAG: hypothetical protein HW388_1516 [Dehalococcoidia bacterium]|nr:hypothetical protein [Dehalococcoidia bacterium]